MDNDNNTYYYCQCDIFQDELIWCEECDKWINAVEEAIEKHLNEFKPVYHAERWKNNKSNKNQKIIMWISIFII